MKESKGVTIVSFIILGIILLPIIAILLYVIFGVALFMILYILTRKKEGRIDPKESKNYKLISSVILVFGAIIMVFAFKVNFNLVPNWNFSELNWSGYFWLQLLVFIGLLPMDYYLIKKLKNEKEVE